MPQVLVILEALFLLKVAKSGDCFPHQTVKDKAFHSEGLFYYMF